MMELDFIVDKITESIELAATGERFETLVLPVASGAEVAGATKANGWSFEWPIEYRKSGRQLYKLVTEKEPATIQGLVALEKRDRDRLIFMSLIENAPHNFGAGKMYDGVCGNLVAFGCKLSKECGFDGYLSFDSKTALVEHYTEKLRATHCGGLKMGILPDAAEWLIHTYFD